MPGMFIVHCSILFVFRQTRSKLCMSQPNFWLHSNRLNHCNNDAINHHQPTIICRSTSGGLSFDGALSHEGGPLLPARPRISKIRYFFLHTPRAPCGLHYNPPLRYTQHQAHPQLCTLSGSIVQTQQKLHTILLLFEWIELCALYDTQQKWCRGAWNWISMPFVINLHPLAFAIAFAKKFDGNQMKKISCITLCQKNAILSRGNRWSFCRANNEHKRSMLCESDIQQGQEISIRALLKRRWLREKGWHFDPEFKRISNLHWNEERLEFSIKAFRDTCLALPGISLRWRAFVADIVLFSSVSLWRNFTMYIRVQNVSLNQKL